MPPASRIGDVALGHGSFPPTAALTGSGDVFTCGPSQHRLGDEVVSHGSKSPSPPHARHTIMGSSSVFTNSKPTVRIGDSVDCGGMLVQGCGTVIVGG
jgi:uncharacterized Zn-binding protein involved in type VI secretion